jgi:hypothetical protein
MNANIENLFRQQAQERERLCGFEGGKVPSVYDSILHLVRKFKGISPSQVIELLQPWHTYMTKVALEQMIFDRRLVVDTMWRNLSEPTGAKSQD